MKKIYIFLLIFIFNSSIAISGNINDLELRVIGNINLDKEFVESVLDTDIELENEELTNYIIKELFSTGFFENVTAEIIDKTLIITAFTMKLLDKIIEFNLTHTI